MVPFLKEIPFPVLASNLDDTLEPSIQGLYKRSTVIDVGGRKVGIVGYLTTETMVSVVFLVVLVREGGVALKGKGDQEYSVRWEIQGGKFVLKVDLIEEYFVRRGDLIVEKGT